MRGLLEVGVDGARGVAGSLPLLFGDDLDLVGVTAVSPSLLKQETPDHSDVFVLILALRNNSAISSCVGCLGYY